eukprot:TRINITY_DN48440_c0_g1_i1.p1 TRINITY_DN48440_c0_g1~~TRINITY_DN48440_c0_g1_i1.p1  ORF type:complete len:645 (-),score=131.08 TRINITY_DN48440_c0_g1_i1:61-1875(-)
MAARCRARGGAVVSVRFASGRAPRSALAAGDVPDALAIDTWPPPGGVEGCAAAGCRPFCVPKRCESAEGMGSDECSELRGNIVGWFATHEQAEPVMRRVEDVHRWLVDGVQQRHPGTDHATARAYAALTAPVGLLEARRRTSSLLELQAAVVGHHGPLAVLAASHLRDAAEAVGVSDLAVKLYGPCYLCEELSACRERHVPSLADAGCDWFHGDPDAATGALAASRDILARLRPKGRPTVVVCLFALLCHFLVQAVPAHVVVLQLLCMNPVQGVPEALAETVLETLRRFALEAPRGGEGGSETEGESSNNGPSPRLHLFATNAVTAALAGYHAAMRVPVLTLFSHDIHVNGVAAAPFAATARSELLLAGSFLLRHHPIAWAFAAALRSLWPHGVVEHQARWDYAGDVAAVREVLQYEAVVYIPEHPYKNFFNDLYAILTPLYLPSLAFLARFWINLQHPENYTTYDGWFDRRLARVRIGSAPSCAACASASAPGAGSGGSTGGSERACEPPEPEPFDLDIDGEAKALYWGRLADYYHFPGVRLFAGAAALVAELSTPSTERTEARMRQREQMKRHVDRRRAHALAVATSIIASAASATLPTAAP